MINNSNETFEDQLIQLIQQNKIVWNALLLAHELNLPDWYVGAGCIAQTVWNHLHEFEPTANISDIDFVYYDNSDLSYENENEVIQLVKKYFQYIAIPVDVKNQARVHLWYKDHFGYDIQPYNSVVDAINTWPTTATSIGIKLTDGKPSIYAPYGLEDLFNQIVRANKAQITKEIYLQKVNKWLSKWPNLKVIEW